MRSRTDEVARALRMGTETAIADEGIHVRLGVVVSVDDAGATCTITLGDGTTEIPDCYVIEPYYPVVSDLVRCLQFDTDLLILGKADSELLPPLHILMLPTDDTAALQVRIDEAIEDAATSTNRDTLIPLALPSGEFNLSAPLRFESVTGLDFHGRGYSTVFRVTEDMTCALDFNGIAQSRIGGFRIIGDAGKQVSRAVWVRWGAGMGRSTANNRFDDIAVDNLEYIRGIQIGEDAAVNQVDSTHWFNCVVRGRQYQDGSGTLWQDGFYAGTGVTSNNLIHTFIGCAAESNVYNLHNAATEVEWLGGALSYATGSDLRLGPGHGGYTIIKGIRSEKSLRLLTTDGPNGTASHVDLSNIDWYATDLDADDEVIQWDHGGHLSVKQLYIPAETGKSPKIVGVLAGYHYSFDLDSITCTTAVEDFAEVGNEDDKLTIRNYAQTTSTDLPLTITPFLSNGPFLITDRTGSGGVGLKRVAGPWLAAIGALVVDEEGAGGGILLFDDGNGIIYPNGGSSRALIMAGWAYAQVPEALQVDGDRVEVLDNSGRYIAKSPDGTRYKLTPPNGGGAATWVAV